MGSLKRLRSLGRTLGFDIALPSACTVSTAHGVGGTWHTYRLKYGAECVPKKHEDTAADVLMHARGEGERASERLADEK